MTSAKRNWRATMAEKVLSNFEMAMQDAQRQLSDRYGDRCRIESRTPESIAAKRKDRATREMARKAAFYPQLPIIVVTKPDVVWNDYHTELRGRFGAVIQD
jgi:hypothetical protein